MDKSTKLAVASGLSLVVGAMLLIFSGEGVLYFSSLLPGSPGSSFGSSLVSAGYGIIALLAIIFVLVLAYLLIRSTGNDPFRSSF